LQSGRPESAIPRVDLRGVSRREFDQYERFLCHYTGRYAALAHVLPMKLLRLSPFELMRDPLEAKDRYISVNPGQSWLGAKHSMLEAVHGGINARVNAVLKQQFKLLSFTQDPDNAANGGEGLFGRGYARPRMWEQYAEGHRGICLLFSYERLIDVVDAQLASQPWSYRGEVRYRSMTDGLRADPQLVLERLTPDVLDAAAEELVADLLPDLFFEKFDDYASEQEYRFVTRAEQRFVHVQYGSALRGVVMGAEFPSEELAPLLLQCAEAGAALLRMEWRQGLGQIAGFYNPTIPLEHNHAPEIAPYRERLAPHHPTLAEYEAR
jgi:hypothetical protein